MMSPGFDVRRTFRRVHADDLGRSGHQQRLTTNTPTTTQRRNVAVVIADDQARRSLAPSPSSGDTRLKLEET